MLLLGAVALFAASVVYLRRLGFQASLLPRLLLSLVYAIALMWSFVLGAFVIVALAFFDRVCRRLSNGTAKG